MSGNQQKQPSGQETPLSVQSSILSRLKARLTHNRLMKHMISIGEPSRTQTLMELRGLRNIHYWGLLISSGMLFLGFYSNVVVSLTRKETFGRNYPYVLEKYGKVHSETLGEGCRPNKFGYPDMGGNLYADLLPFADWVKMSNA